jgi:hypothetical protein
MVRRLEEIDLPRLLLYIGANGFLQGFALWAYTTIYGILVLGSAVKSRENCPQLTTVALTPAFPTAQLGFSAFHFLDYVRVQTV